MIPNGWHDVSVYEYKSIYDIINNDESIFSKFLSIFEILNPDEDFGSKDVEEFNELINQNDWIVTTPSLNFKQSVDRFHLKPFQKHNLAEWIDLDTFVKKMDFLSCCSILYKQKKINEWGHTIWEPYEYDVEERSEELSDFLITDIFGAYTSYLKYREKILNLYHEAFEAPEEDYEPSEEDKQILSEEEIRQVKKEVEEEKKKQEFSWQYFLDGLSQGDMTKHEQILNMPAIYVFNMFIMIKRFKKNL